MVCHFFYFEMCFILNTFVRLLCCDFEFFWVSHVVPRALQRENGFLKTEKKIGNLCAIQYRRQVSTLFCEQRVLSQVKRRRLYNNFLQCECENYLQSQIYVQSFFKRYKVLLSLILHYIRLKLFSVSSKNVLCLNLLTICFIILRYKIVCNAFAFVIQ